MARPLDSPDVSSPSGRSGDCYYGGLRDAIWSRTLSAASRRTLLESDPLPRTADVAVVGAGLVGLCTALSLRRRGVSNIVVLDRNSVCGEATGASAGGLWPAHECLSLAAPDIARRARDAHVRLRDDFPCDYVSSGLLDLVEEGGTGQALDRVRRTEQAGFRAEVLSGRALSDCEPLLQHNGEAVYFPGDGSIHPLKLAAAITSWLRRSDVKICLNQEVLSADGDAPSIATADALLSAGAVVVAAGAWTPLLTKLLGWSPPIRPIRGTLLATEARPQGTLRSVVVASRYYYWQLACGPVAGGGSEEDVGFREGVNAAVEADIRQEYAHLFPALRDVPVTCRWSGFRPFCEDMHPVIGRVPGFRDVFVSAGHFRKGILLAPLSGDLLADELLQHSTEGPTVFRPDRFPATARTG